MSKKPKISTNSDLYPVSERVPGDEMLRSEDSPPYGSTPSGTMTPFANESDAISIGGLSIENRTDRISIYGSIDITRDRAGLAHAEQLQALFASIVAAMQQQALPAAISIKPAEDVDNPFA